MRKLTRIGNHLHFKEFCRESQSLFIYHAGYHHTYPSGKKFNRNVWFELSDKVLEDYFAAPEDNFNTKTCHFLSKEAHIFIDKCVYKGKFKKNQEAQDKDNNMTKADEEKIRQECAEGKHACSAEYLIKEKKKAERRAEKAAQKRIDKSNTALVKALAQIEKLEQENAELRAELKAQAEREMPDDSVSYENGTLCHEMDEQDKQLVEACEAELARDIFLDRHSSDDALADDKEALVDECIEILRRKHEANASAPYKSVSSIDDPTLVKRITCVKNVLQQAFDRSYLSFEEAKLYLRAKFGIKIELDRQHAIDWNKYQTLESVDWRRKLFKEADEAIARGEWSYASQDDIEMVRDRHETLEN